MRLAVTERGRMTGKMMMVEVRGQKKAA